MNTNGPNPITRRKVTQLAESAAQFIEAERQIESYKELAPIFQQFITANMKFRECFDWLLSQDLVRETQFRSVQDAYSAVKNGK